MLILNSYPENSETSSELTHISPQLQVCLITLCPLAPMRMLMRVYLVICPIPILDFGFGPDTDTWFRSYTKTPKQVLT